MINRIALIAGNEGKAREYTTLLGIDVNAVTEDLVEIQSLDVAEVGPGRLFQVARAGPGR